MRVKALVNYVMLSKNMYKHLMELNIISKMTEVGNILAFCKILCKDLQCGKIKNNDCINLAISTLKQLKKNETDDDNSSSWIHFVKFVIEQLHLLQLSKHGQRYSSDLITMAFLWKLTSSSLYKRFTDVFFLPSTRRLQQLSVDLNVEARQVDITYLKQRTCDFTEGERAVVLLIDEDYTA